MIVYPTDGSVELYINDKILLETFSNSLGVRLSVSCLQNIQVENW